MEKFEEAGKLANTLTVDRPFSLPGILLGTSAFTATGWEGSFYPPGMQPRHFLSYYATQFATVEVDSTFYGCPSPRTVNNWAARTPEGFVFSVKVPQTITHEKVLVDQVDYEVSQRHQPDECSIAAGALLFGNATPASLGIRNKLACILVSKRLVCCPI